MDETPKTPESDADDIDLRPMGNRIIEAAAQIKGAVDEMVRLGLENKQILAEYAAFKEAQLVINQNREDDQKKFSRLLLVFAATFVVFVIYAVWTQGKFDDQTTTAKKNCISANENRVKDLSTWNLEFKKWDKILNKPTTASTTLEQKQDRDDFIASQNEQKQFIAEKDALRECDKANSDDPVQTIPAPSTTSTSTTQGG